MEVEKIITFYKLDNGLRFAIKNQDNKAILMSLPSKTEIRSVNADRQLELLRYMKSIEEKVKVEIKE